MCCVWCVSVYGGGGVERVRGGGGGVVGGKADLAVVNAKG